MKIKPLSDDLGQLIQEFENDTKKSFDLLGKEYSTSRIKQSLRNKKSLDKIGFSFNNLFKYNEFHENLDKANDSLQIWGGNEKDLLNKFLQTVRRAYFEFYTRDDFVTTYRELIEIGYYNLPD